MGENVNKRAAAAAVIDDKQPETNDDAAFSQTKRPKVLTKEAEEERVARAVTENAAAKKAAEKAAAENAARKYFQNCKRWEQICEAALGAAEVAEKACARKAALHFKEEKAQKAENVEKSELQKAREIK